MYIYNKSVLIFHNIKCWHDLIFKKITDSQYLENYLPGIPLGIIINSCYVLKIVINKISRILKYV